ncbi:MULTISPECIES: NAD(P)/FAD-dependent oxidoreductase [Burkholderiaceae]|uniref:Amine oxidase, flavin-containing n=1 Tax=Caballeronia sordidicola TaxID=196367 RepID=A0A242MWE0_CABSO|nr:MULTISPECIES: FAD-dependent oxidoreductase [Burkholderiaceae]AME23609.1 NADH-ubiquinone oxidoreductase subunit 6 [Burkholderia sp. PAMC 26561]OTP75759.1 Amine oxidase, flavin-containing [Caballeronia sordidicola]
MKVAVIGAGISGLSCAYRLAKSQAGIDVTLFEANGYFGGHTNTVDVTLDGVTHGVDTGFLVFNHRTYPNLVKLFQELDVPTTATDMSFSVAVTDKHLEWAGSDLNTVFTQRRNLLRPAFLRMLADILRFNRTTTAMALAGKDVELAEPVSRFIEREKYSVAFRDWYLLPMIGAIWSCSTTQMMAFPIGTLIRFCHNHGLLQVNDRPQWHTVNGGAREYVRRMLPAIGDAHAGLPVTSVKRGAFGVEVESTRGIEHFDHVVLACHSDQALALLADPSNDETVTLGAIGYAPNRAVLHTDASLLPAERAWSAWNYESRTGELGAEPQLCVHYLINKLQPLPFKTPVIVSLNPVREPRPETVLREFAYSHPVFDQAAVQAQRVMPSIQGARNTWFAGAWTGYGFHEDGLKSGLDAAARLTAIALNRDEPALAA